MFDLDGSKERIDQELRKGLVDQSKVFEWMKLRWMMIRFDGIGLHQIR